MQDLRLVMTFASSDDSNMLQNQFSLHVKTDGNWTRQIYKFFIYIQPTYKHDVWKILQQVL